jgi:glutaredoxin
MIYNFDKDILLQIPWNEENVELGSKQKVAIFYFALTTCAYCKRGIQWLKDKKIAFHWIHLDTIDIDVRQQIKEWLKQKYKTQTTFPFVIFRLSEKDYISSGFDPDYWGSKIK